MTCVADPNCPLMEECEELLNSIPRFGDGIYNPFHFYLYQMIHKVWDEYHPGMKCQLEVEDNVD